MSWRAGGAHLWVLPGANVLAAVQHGRLLRIRQGGDYKHQERLSLTRAPAVAGSLDPTGMQQRELVASCAACKQACWAASAQWARQGDS